MSAGAATSTRTRARAQPPAAGTEKGQDGLSIRPQLLLLSPMYRRARDSILRPHLRMTESRYFWEKWKPLLGPDATVLIMEVRDRCNKSLQAMGAGGLGSEGALGGGLTMSAADAAGLDGCTVSAVELASACGFSRVTLWRLLQREDVRQFVRVEHNYVYDRRLGKKRRTVSTYQVLMEDPLVPEDEPRLAALLGMAPNGAPNGAAHAPTFQTETEVVDNAPPTFHFETATGGSRQKRQNVEETKLNQRLEETQTVPSFTAVPEAFATASAAPMRSLMLGASGGAAAAPEAARGGGPTRLGSLLGAFAMPAAREAAGAAGGREVQSPGGSASAPAASFSRLVSAVSPVPTAHGTTGSGAHPAQVSPGGEGRDPDIWHKYPQFAHLIEEAETVLGDRHSRGFYITALKRLYPGHVGVWQRALGLPREQQNIRRSRGALFTRLLRTFAAEAGVSL